MPNYQVSPADRQARINALAPLFEYMNSRGMKRSWLAKQLGISPTRLGYYERGINRPPAWLMQRACEIVGVDFGQIKLSEHSEKQRIS